MEGEQAGVCLIEETLETLAAKSPGADADTVTSDGGDGESSLFGNTFLVLIFKLDVGEAPQTTIANISFG